MEGATPGINSTTNPTTTIWEGGPALTTLGRTTPARTTGEATREAPATGGRPPIGEATTTGATRTRINGSSPAREAWVALWAEEAWSPEEEVPIPPQPSHRDKS